MGPDGGDAVGTTGFRFVSLADEDGLAVAGLQPEPEFACPVLVNLEFTSHFWSPSYCKVLYWNPIVSRHASAPEPAIYYVPKVMI
jgi:hypothetical protein